MFFLDSEHVGKGEMLPKMLTISIELGAIPYQFFPEEKNSPPSFKGAPEMGTAGDY